MFNNKCEGKFEMVTVAGGFSVCEYSAGNQSVFFG